MRHIERYLALTVCVVSAWFSQTAALSQTAPKPKAKAAPSASAKTSVASRASTANKAPAKAGAQRKTASRARTTVARKSTVAKRRAVPAGPPRQLTPTPDRYREIQQALIDKGYLKSEANGTWDAQSTDALQRFQTDRKLAPTGKINAPSLIGLGLGPKTAGAASLAPPSAAPGQTAVGEPVEVPPAPDVIPVPDAAASR